MGTKPPKNPPAGGASVTVWCAVIKVLAKKYPRRAASQELLNETISLVQQLETLYAAAPEIKKP
jgi:hypothetical protein